MIVKPGSSDSTVLPSASIKWIAIGVLLINLFVIAIVALALRQSRLQYEQRTAVSTQNLSDVLEQYIAGDIDKIDLALFAVGEEVVRRRSSGGIDTKAMNAYAFRILSRLPFVNAIRMADEHGEIVFGAGKETMTKRPDISVSDRDYFKRLRNNPNAALVISKPVLARISGRWVIIFARRLNKPDGSFDGAIWAAIELEQFNQTFARLNVGRNGVVSLRDSEMTLIARHPELKGDFSSSGQRKVSQELMDQVEAGISSGTYYTPTGADNTARTVSFRKIGAYPLYIIVGLATSEYLVQWKKEVLKMSGLTALFALITVLSSRLLYLDSANRRRAEESLRESEERFKMLFEYSPDGILLADVETRRFHSSNRTMCEMLGCTKEEIRGLGISDIHPEQDLAYITSEFGRQLSGAHPLAVDIPVKRKDGSVFYADVNSFSMTFSGKQYLVGSFRDITERKKADKKIARLNRLYTVLSEINKAIVRTRDLDDLYEQACKIAVEDGLFRMAWIGIVDADTSLVKPVAKYGYDNNYLDVIRISVDPNEAEGSGPTGSSLREKKYIINNDTENNLSMSHWRDEALKRGYLSSAVFPLLKGGKLFGGINLYAGEPFYFTEAEIELLVSLSNDISFAIESIRNEENFRQLIDRNPVAMAESDKQGNFIFFNNKFIQTFGYTMEDIPTVDAWWQSACPDKEYRQKVMSNWRLSAEQATVSGKESSAQEWKITCKNGSLRDIEFRMSAMEDFNIIIFHDITERKALEQQLLQAQKMQAVGQLAGGIAHDFNNILTAIIGYGGLVQQSVENDPLSRGYIRQVLDAAERAEDLTRRLLAFSRKQVIEPVLADLNEIVRNIEKMLRRLITEDIELSTVLSAAELPVLVDAGQIERVLMNLAVNAYDAMPEGGHLVIQTDAVNIDAIYAEAHIFESAGMYAVLTVSDTGLGMDERTKENIFEPFFTTKEVDKGTGLGLSMVYGIIKQHNGSINVYSEVGKGTTFKIYLPLAQTTREAISKTVEILPQGKGETIIIAEDEPQVREIIMTLLRESGYKIIEARNGEEAIKKFRENRGTVSLMLLDVIMPVKNGREAYEEIKSIDPGIKTIFMSGYTDEIISKKGILEEGFDFISKPLNPDKLMRKIRDVMDRQNT
ncbi:MAG: PAS domain S-box protein [Syntrophobacteraceae bacterium]